MHKREKEKLRSLRDSCELQLILTIHDLAKSLDCRTPLDMIIMDFSKAFDTVPHNRLLHKLHSHDITGNTHKWITKFLTKRKQRVVVNGEHCKWVHVKFGVPQGTVTGPLLFLIYLNRSHSYLGVNISHDLRWVEHNSTISKANRVLGVIRRNFHSCPTELKAIAYKSLVRPHLEYSGTVWDPYTNDLIQKLEAVQRRAARFVCRDYIPYSSITTMLKNLEWDTLQLRGRQPDWLWCIRSLTVRLPYRRRIYYCQPNAHLVTPTLNLSSGLAQRRTALRNHSFLALFMNGIAHQNI